MEDRNREMRLLKKGQSGLRQLLLGRMTIVLALLIGQFLLLIAVFAWFEEYYIHYFGGSAVLALIMVLFLQNQHMEPSTRTSWLVLILSLPVFGTALYFFTRYEVGSRLLRKVVNKQMQNTSVNPAHGNDELNRLADKDPGAAAMCRFIVNHGGGNVYGNTGTTYFPAGEQMLEQMLHELEKAQNHIYLEYFIIREGTMWGRILEILSRKAAEGVDVRVMYDGTSEFILLPKSYPKKLAKLGIKCKVFSPFAAFVSTHYNYRDHRKIMVIDGHTAFTGGINLSDEYINIGSHFGHWKDTAVMLKGEAARGLELLFLQMWNLDRRKSNEATFAPVLQIPTNGHVLPFGDNPLDQVKTGQTVYMDLLNRARESVSIMTPYLIIDEAMEQALCYAARRGVRVQLLLPGIPDKYVPYALAKTHYKVLLDAGVEIYEYTPGFDHGKMMVVDGREAVVGTINFDYRSFCHHFECAVYMYGCDCITDIAADFSSCLTVSRRVTQDTLKREKWHYKLTGYLLKGFAPLL